MITYCDASGSSSGRFDLNQQYYVLCFVYFDINECDSETNLIKFVKEFCATEGIEEVKWGRMNRSRRTAFASALAKQKFRFLTFAIDRRLYPVSDTSTLLKQAFGITLQVGRTKGLLYPEIVSDRDFSKELLSPLRRVINLLLKRTISLPDVSDFRLEDSHKYPGIQVADFLAGLYRSVIFGKLGTGEYLGLYDLVKDKHVGKVGNH